MCHTSTTNSNVKPYAAMSEIAPSSNRSFGPVRVAMRPATGESSIITSPDGMTMKLARDERQSEPGARGDGQFEHLRVDDVRGEE